MRSLKASNEHFRKSLSKLPLGVASSYRYWGAKKTIYAQSGKGARIRDMDGNEYIDYRLGFGPIILGYADDRVDEAAHAAMKVGGIFGLATELEYNVARRISEMVPAAELVRFSNSGTEVVMVALRLARAHSGKDGHILVEGGYHGGCNEVLWYADVKKWDPKRGNPEIKPTSEGVPRVISELVHAVPLNDANALEDVLKKHGDKIGALLIEPILGNCGGISATPEYARDVRALCDKYDVILIIDEVKTGFRVAKGGAQELFGVKADLCTFAKAIANGYPIAAIAGREDMMRRIGDDVTHGGTFNGHPVSLAAADKTLEILAETDALANVAGSGEKLKQGFDKILTSAGIQHSFPGHPSMFGLFFMPDPPTNYREWVNSGYEFYEALAEELHELGILIEPDSREPFFMCEAHDAACIDETLDKFAKAVDITMNKSPEEHRKVISS